MLLNMFPGAFQIALMLLEQLEPLHDHISVRLEAHVAVAIRVAFTSGQVGTLVRHVTQQRLAARPLSALHHKLASFQQPAVDVKFEIIRHPLCLLTEPLHVLHRVGEVIHKGWCEYQHIATLASINKDVSFDLRQITEKAVNSCAAYKPISRSQSGCGDTTCLDAQQSYWFR